MAKVDQRAESARMNLEHEARVLTAHDSGVVMMQASTCFPINSKRHMASYLLCIARAMELPEQGTNDQLRVMKEGKLMELG